MVHSVNVTGVTRNFSCPLNCGEHAFQTYKELLHHCKGVHQEELDIIHINFHISVVLICLLIIIRIDNPNFSLSQEFWYCMEGTTYSTYVKPWQTYFPYSSGMLNHVLLQSVYINSVFYSKLRFKHQGTILLLMGMI